MIILSIFELVTAFCLLKGILLHSGIIHKDLAQLHTRYKISKQYLLHYFSEDGFPLPWNLLFLLVKIITFGKYPKHQEVNLEAGFEQEKATHRGTLSKNSKSVQRLESVPEKTFEL